MSIKLSDSIRVGQQKPLEDKYFNELVPYTSTTQVNDLLPKAVRHIGLTVNINGEEYWYKDGIEDSNLVLKITNSDTSNLVPYTGANKDVNIGAHYFESSQGFKKTGGTSNQALTANGGTFDLTTKADLVDGKIPSSQLPSYVDDVLEYANLASFPATGESGKIYIAIDTNITYRWSGSAYVKIGGSSETVLLRHITPTAPITGTTTETILYTWFIPANTFNTEDWIRLQDLTILSNTRLLSNAQVRVRFNDSNTLNTSISKLLATGVFPSGGLSGVSRYVKMTRSFDVFDGNIASAYTIAGFNTDFQSSNYNINPFNPTIDNWLFVTIQLGNVSDSVYMKNLIITK